MGIKDLFYEEVDDEGNKIKKIKELSTKPKLKLTWGTLKKWYFWALFIFNFVGGLSIYNSIGVSIVVGWISTIILLFIIFETINASRKEKKLEFIGWLTFIATLIFFNIWGLFKNDILIITAAILFGILWIIVLILLVQYSVNKIKSRKQSKSRGL